MNGKILKTVENLINRHGTNEPEELCHRLGLVLLDYDLPDITKGFCLTLSSGRAIVLNNRLHKAERQACIAHELGHALLHSGLNYMFVSQNTCMVTGKYEKEADLFAAALLLWKKQLPEGSTIEQTAKKHHLPISAVESFFGYID